MAEILFLVEDAPEGGHTTSRYLKLEPGAGRVSCTYGRELIRQDSVIMMGVWLRKKTARSQP